VTVVREPIRGGVCNARRDRTRESGEAGAAVRAWLIGLTVLLLAHPARAELTVEITRGVDDPVPAAVVPFAWNAGGSAPEDLADIVQFDLARSGQFRMTPPQDMLSMPTREEELYFRDWRIQSVSYVLIGRVERAADGDGLRVHYALFDVYGERKVLDETLDTRRGRLRDAAHSISDRVYEQLTGIPGAFSTKILYVVARDIATADARFRLEVADADGARPRTLLASDEPILSARWSPDGTRVAYVSFEGRKPAIYVHNVKTDARSKVTDFAGLNGAPAWSPDGEKLAVVLSVDDNPNIYVLDLASGQLEQITRHFGIDTEPEWSPDGEHIIFTSDRGGRPQIYRTTLESGAIERLTFQGGYNARGRLLSDGRHMVYVHRRRGTYHIALMDLESGDVRVLTETTLDESPSVAPNGSMVMYATQQGGRGILAVVSIDGRVKYRLPSTRGDVREPDWSPYLD